MRGALVYALKDVYRNQSYINWLINDFRGSGIELELVLNKDFNRNCCIKYDFLVNRSRDYIINKLAEQNNVLSINNSNFK